MIGWAHILLIMCYDGLILLLKGCWLSKQLMLFDNSCGTYTQSLNMKQVNHHYQTLLSLFLFDKYIKHKVCKTNK